MATARRPSCCEAIPAARQAGCRSDADWRFHPSRLGSEFTQRFGQHVVDPLCFVRGGLLGLAPRSSACSGQNSRGFRLGPLLCRSRPSALVRLGREFRARRPACPRSIARHAWSRRAEIATINGQSCAQRAIGSWRSHAIIRPIKGLRTVQLRWRIGNMIFQWCQSCLVSGRREPSDGAKHEAANSMSAGSRPQWLGLRFRPLPPCD